LRRRGDEDLLLVTISRAEQSAEMTSVAIGLLSELAQHEPGRAMILDALPKVFPWVLYLPEPDRAEFAGELIGTLRTADSVESPVPAVQLVTEWRHTAEVHADPELRELVRSTSGDFGEVPRPLMS